MRVSTFLAAAACVLLPVLPSTAAAQTAPSSDEKAVLAVVQRLFEGMRTADTAMVRSNFASSARFAIVARDTIRFLPVDGWIDAIGKSERRWNEQIYDVQVRVDANMAQVWAPYTFYLDGKVRHCGVDTIELLRDSQGWKITQLSDTQRREGCRDPLAK